MLGMASTVVNPPANAAAVPVDQSSLWVWPGSRMWVCTSIRPGSRSVIGRSRPKKKTPKAGVETSRGEVRPRSVKIASFKTPCHTTPDPVLAECMSFGATPPSGSSWRHRREDDPSSGLRQQPTQPLQSSKLQGGHRGQWLGELTLSQEG